MAGKKGRSGRKPLHIEVEEIVDTNKLFNLSFRTLTSALNNPRVKLSKKIDIALAIYCKHLPNKNEHTGNLTVDYDHRKPLNPKA